MKKCHPSTRTVALDVQHISFLVTHVLRVDRLFAYVTFRLFFETSGTVRLSVFIEKFAYHGLLTLETCEMFLERSEKIPRNFQEISGYDTRN